MVYDKTKPFGNLGTNKKAEEVITEALEIVSQLSPQMREHVARLAIEALQREGMI